MAGCKLKELQQAGRTRLARCGIDSAKLDADLLLRRVTGFTAAQLISHDNDLIPPHTAQAYLALIERRAAGEPAAYLLGHREFWSLDLKVTPAVLIPRPDTEVLVEAALQLSFDSVLDLGTGSGAIILAIKKERPQCSACAVDRSEAALAVAQQNAQEHHLDVEFVHSSWFAALPGRRFDLIVSNPPYIAPADPHLYLNGLNYEPQEALVAADDGYADLQQIISEAAGHLNPGGHLLLEHGNTQHEKVAQLLAAHGFTAVLGIKDYAGWIRVTQGRLISQLQVYAKSC